MRLRTDFWVSALRRRAEAAGAYVAVARRGAEEAGAIFVSVDTRDGLFDLYGPAPQTARGEPGQDRLFSKLAARILADDLRTRLDREIRFDSDLWLLDIEDRAGRPFIEIAPDG